MLLYYILLLLLYIVCLCYVFFLKVNVKSLFSGFFILLKIFSADDCSFKLSSLLREGEREGGERGRVRIFINPAVSYLNCFCNVVSLVCVSWSSCLTIDWWEETVREGVSLIITYGIVPISDITVC